MKPKIKRIIGWIMLVFILSIFFIIIPLVIAGWFYLKFIGIAILCMIWVKTAIYLIETN